MPAKRKQSYVGTKFVQTRIPNDVMSKLRAAAKREHITVAGYVRSLIIADCKRIEGTDGDVLPEPGRGPDVLSRTEG